jgi:hypothetical protein
MQEDLKMRNLLIMKEQFKGLYSRFGNIVVPIARFLAALISMLLINANIGAFGVLENPLVVVAVSVVCAFLPSSLITMILSLVIVGHIYAVSLEMAGFAVAVLVVMYLLYFRFSAGDGVLLILVPILFLMKIPYVAPLVVGLLASPFSIVAAAFGIVMYFMMHYMHTADLSGTDGMTLMTDFAKGVFSNQAMYLFITAFAVVIVAVFVIRKLSIQNSWMIAVAAGTVVNLVIMLIGGAIFQIGDMVSIPQIIVGTILSAVLAFLVSFMMHNADYSRTENVQFEDDDYYYYVKAVPKVKVSSDKVKVRRVNAAKASKKK